MAAKSIILAGVADCSGRAARPWRGSACDNRSRVAIVDIIARFFGLRCGGGPFVEVPMASPIMRCFFAVPFAVAISTLALAQRPSSNERQIEPLPNVQDKADIWTMNFEHQDPRMLVV